MAIAYRVSAATWGVPRACVCESNYQKPCNYDVILTIAATPPYPRPLCLARHGVRVRFAVLHNLHTFSFGHFACRVRLRYLHFFFSSSSSVVARPFYGSFFAFIAPLTFCADGLITIQLIDAAAAFRGAFAARIAEHGRHYAQAEEHPL